MLGKKFQGIGGQKYLEERAHVQMTGCNATHNGLKFFLKEYLKISIHNATDYGRPERK